MFKNSRLRYWWKNNGTTVETNINEYYPGYADWGYSYIKKSMYRFTLNKLIPEIPEITSFTNTLQIRCLFNVALINLIKDGEFSKRNSSILHSLLSDAFLTLITCVTLYAFHV